MVTPFPVFEKHWELKTVITLADDQDCTVKVTLLDLLCITRLCYKANVTHQKIIHVFIRRLTQHYISYKTLYDVRYFYKIICLCYVVEGLSDMYGFRLKPDTSNSHGFELHRPSNKGTKLLLKVIKAIIIIMFLQGHIIPSTYSVQHILYIYSITYFVQQHVLIFNTYGLYDTFVQQHIYVFK